MSDEDELARLYDTEAFRRQGHALVDVLADHLHAAMSDPHAKAVRWLDPDTQLDAWPATPPVAGEGDVVSLLTRVAEGSVHQHSPRCLGYQVCPPIPTVALADLAASVLNNGMASYDSGPVSTVLERHVVRWLAQVLGMPAGADGVLTSGGTLGNLTALLAARQLKAGGDAWNTGTDGRELAVLVSEEAHYCISRAVGIMGWGHDGAISVPSDADYRLRADALRTGLERANEAGRRVIAVVATTGTTATGSFDPLVEIAEFCEEHDLWLHIDGAHGAAAALSEQHRHLLAGVDRVDSIVWDAHKMLAIPSLCTGVLFRDGSHSYEPFEQKASYLFSSADASEQWYNSALRTLECTKTMMSLKLYTALHSVGTARLGALVARMFDLGAELGDLLSRSPDFEAPIAPTCNIVCFRYAPAGVGDLDALQLAIRERLVRDGRYFVAKTTLRGRVYLRSTLMNPLTTSTDLGEFLTAIADAGRTLV